MTRTFVRCGALALALATLSTTAVAQTPTGTVRGRITDAGNGRGLDPEERRRLEVIKVQLDRAYDLLHQRQGRRDAGLDPADTAERPARVVESYEQ